MKKEYEVLNIKCGGCATSVSDKLKQRFPDVEVDLDTEPRKIKATVKSDQDEAWLISELKSMGYPLASDELGAITKKYLYSKSYVSCMKGRVKQ